MAKFDEIDYVNQSDVYAGSQYFYNDYEEIQMANESIAENSNETLKTIQDLPETPFRRKKADIAPYVTPRLSSPLSYRANTFRSSCDIPNQNDSHKLNKLMSFFTNSTVKNTEDHPEHKELIMISAKKLN